MDIGCHHGETLLRFLESGVRCPVSAFDPFVSNIQKAREFLRDYPHVKFHEVALSDEDGKARFFMNRNDQTSSLLPNADGNRESFPNDTAQMGVTDVKTARLDTWARIHLPTGLSVVKCDTQGAEGKIISGGLTFIRNQVAAFYCEVMLGQMYEGQSSFDEIRHLLEHECGLVLKNVYPCFHDSCGRAVQMDALWVKPGLLSKYSP